MTYQIRRQARPIEVRHVVIEVNSDGTGEEIAWFVSETQANNFIALLNFQAAIRALEPPRLWKSIPPETSPPQPPGPPAPRPED